MRIETFGTVIELSRRTVYVQSPAGELWAERCAAWRLDFWKANGALYFHLGPLLGNLSRSKPSAALLAEPEAETHANTETDRTTEMRRTLELIMEAGKLGATYEASRSAQEANERPSAGHTS